MLIKTMTLVLFFLTSFAAWAQPQYLDIRFDGEGCRLEPRVDWGKEVKIFFVDFHTEAGKFVNCNLTLLVNLDPNQQVYIDGVKMKYFAFLQEDDGGSAAIEGGVSNYRETALENVNRATGSNAREIVLGDPTFPHLWSPCGGPVEFELSFQISIRSNSSSSSHISVTEINLPPLIAQSCLSN